MPRGGADPAQLCCVQECVSPTYAKTRHRLRLRKTRPRRNRRVPESNTHHRRLPYRSTLLMAHRMAVAETMGRSRSSGTQSVRGEYGRDTPHMGRTEKKAGSPPTHRCYLIGRVQTAMYSSRGRSTCKRCRRTVRTARSTRDGMQTHGRHHRTCKMDTHDDCPRGRYADCHAPMRPRLRRPSM